MAVRSQALRVAARALEQRISAECAGINRHEGENERVLQERNSEPS